MLVDIDYWKERAENAEQRVAELEQAIDDINVGLKDGKVVIWLMNKPGFYLSAREAIDAAIDKAKEDEE